MKSAPIPKNEIARIMALSDLDPNYADLKDTFRDLTKLAAKVTGSPISLVNLIDNYTVWTVSSYGLDVEQTPREESVCQYTILEKDQFVVNDMSVDPVFHDADFVTDGLHFRFYHGIPLVSQDQNVGALCVLDMTAKTLTPEKVEMLKIISGEIMNRLKTVSYIESLRNKVDEVKHTQNKVVHDIRGPIAGIMGLAEIISMQGKENDLDEVLEFIGLIHKGGKSVLELADEILTEEKRSRTARPSEMTLHTFKARLEELYTPQAKSKDITLKIEIDGGIEIPFPQNKLMQIAGNLVSNAIKFTPRGGSVTVGLNVEIADTANILRISVKDTGNGIDDDQIARLLADNTESADGTDGEKGYGFGLALVKHLIKGLNGSFNITSVINDGATFEITIPYNRRFK
ncbi:GAF domain-containing sensor histidine kinase [Nemorincola caseinilytica]|uniref:histidine kinase n=1 Tax=Nemorincola caseinilytica TaxID=2054315 RepID=A0ABP8N1G5_9BACT